METENGEPCLLPGEGISRPRFSESEEIEVLLCVHSESFNAGPEWVLHLDLEGHLSIPVLHDCPSTHVHTHITPTP